MQKRSNVDFAKDSIPSLVAKMALPLIAAQLVNVLYNVVDRIYIGHIPGIGSAALTGVGLAMPIITIVAAFAGLFGQGGGPLCSIAYGRGDTEEAARVEGNAFTMLLLSSAVLTAVSLPLAEPMLRLFGAGEESLSHAVGYLKLYLIGTPFVYLSLGMNVYINAQGFSTKGMLTVLLGAVANIILDPIFIFALGMGVRGAAIATVLSQALSCAWCLSFLFGKKALLKLTRRSMILSGALDGRIISLGMADFIVGVTNSAIQAAANRQLGVYGGDLYIGVMTAISALKTVVVEIFRGFGAGLQPILGFNYGSGQKRRVLRCIRFSTIVGVSVAVLTWALAMLIPETLIRIFTEDEALIRAAVPAVRIYFCGYAFMCMQFVAQNCFRSLGMAKQAIFFSLLRKIVLVVPLMLLLPGVFGLGVHGVFWSEPISDLLGGAASFITMLVTLCIPMARELKAEEVS